jgi:hypothetical protein
LILEQIGHHFSHRRANRAVPAVAVGGGAGDTAGEGVGEFVRECVGFQGLDLAGGFAVQGVDGRAQDGVLQRVFQVAAFDGGVGKGAAAGVDQVVGELVAEGGTATGVYNRGRPILLLDSRCASIRCRCRFTSSCPSGGTNPVHGVCS